MLSILLSIKQVATLKKATEINIYARSYRWKQTNNEKNTKNCGVTSEVL